MNTLSYIYGHLLIPWDKNENIKKDDPIIDLVKDYDCTTTTTTTTSSTDNDEVIIDEEDPEDPEDIIKERLRFVNIILFLPNYLLIKPLLFLWFIITFPLYRIEHSIKHYNTKNKQIHNNNDDDEKKNENQLFNNTLNPILEDDDLNNGDEIILQNDNFKNYQNIITTTTTNNKIINSKKMGKFLFPKKLIPKSILFSDRKKLLVLDLDETLIHSNTRNYSTTGHMIEIKFNNLGTNNLTNKSNISTLYYVYKRPYVDLFLSKVSKWYDLIIFTASVKEYADPVIDWLQESSFNGKFIKRYYRNDCILRDGIGYIKDLSIINNNLLNEIILIDNSPISYAINIDNAIQVQGWISDPTDTDLLNLLPFLEALRFTTDVRNLLSLKNGERAFNG